MQKSLEYSGIMEKCLHGYLMVNGTAYDRSNSYLTIPKNDYIVAEKNFCFHRENTLREERNNVRIYAGLSDGHRPDR